MATGSGAWNFGSGTGHSAYVAAGFIPTVGGQMVTGDDGIPPLLVAVIPRREIVFTDGWNVQGLKGTGSYDYNVTDLFVPGYRTFELFTRAPQPGGSPRRSGWGSSRSPRPATPRGPSVCPRACSTT